MVFGNRLVPTTLSILVEEAHFVYSTKPAASRLDHFMHFAKCKAENFKVRKETPTYTTDLELPSQQYIKKDALASSIEKLEMKLYVN